MDTINKKQLLQALALFSFALKGNTDDPDFEATDAGIEVENLAFATAELAGFDLDAHISYFNRATVFERCRFMIKQLTTLLDSESQEQLYVTILGCPEFNSPEYLFNHEERLAELNIELWTPSNLSDIESTDVSAISNLELFEGIIASTQQSFSVFRVK